MDDLISRQAAIDALKHNQDVYSHNFHDDPIDKYTTAIIAVDIDSLVKLPSVQPEQRWIPVEEELPKNGKEVLVTRHYLGEEDNNKSCYYVEVATRYGEDNDPVWTSYSDEYKMHPKNHIVIAWMPLPEGYQEENKHEID